MAKSKDRSKTRRRRRDARRCKIACPCGQVGCETGRGPGGRLLNMDRQLRRAELAQREWSEKEVVVSRKKPLRVWSTVEETRCFDWVAPNGATWKVQYLTPYLNVGGGDDGSEAHELELQLTMAELVVDSAISYEAVDLVNEEEDHTLLDEAGLVALHNLAVDDYDAYVAGESQTDQEFENYMAQNREMLSRELGLDP